MDCSVSSCPSFQLARLTQQPPVTSHFLELISVSFRFCFSGRTLMDALSEGARDGGAVSALYSIASCPRKHVDV